MDVNLLFPSLYLRCADLRGRDVTLTIDRVQMDSLRTDHGTERKPVMFFREMEERSQRDSEKPNKRLVMNKTNAMTIAKMLGTETDDWKGKRVTFFPATCAAFGETVDCIRVRPAAPQSRTNADARLSDQEKQDIDRQERGDSL